MAKIKKKNILIENLSGSVGDLVFRQMPDGSTRVSRKPVFSKRESSQAQLDQQNRIKLASAYASQAKTLPVYVERARRKKKTAFNLAMADWFHPPVIHSLERRDGRIRVQASDDMQVTRVEVRILDSEGSVLAQGQAEQVDPLYWEYATEAAPSVNRDGTGAGTLEASAWDLAGNVTVAVL
jgi:hypothetical protein